MPREGRVYRDKNAERFLGVGVEHPKHDKNVGVIFRTAAIMGNVNFLYTVGATYERPRSDTVESWRVLPTFNYETFKDLHGALPLGCELIGVELDERAKPLETFRWPDRAVLLFGAEGEGLSKQARESCRQLIKVPAKLSVSYNLSSVASMVMYDHFLKKGFA